MSKKDAVVGLIYTKEQVQAWKELGATREDLRYLNQASIVRKNIARRLKSTGYEHIAPALAEQTDFMALDCLRRELNSRKQAEAMQNLARSISIISQALVRH